MVVAGLHRHLLGVKDDSTASPAAVVGQDRGRLHGRLRVERVLDDHLEQLLRAGAAVDAAVGTCRLSIVVDKWIMQHGDAIVAD